MSLNTFPPAPGSVLRHQILDRIGIRQADLARAMGVSAVRIHQIVNGRAPISPEIALRLGRVTDTAPEYWLALQSEFALHRARHRLALTLEALHPLRAVEADR